MNKLPTKLLEYLVKQCTKEVLDQIAEEKKIKVKFAKEKETEIPVKHKIQTTVGKDSKFRPKVRRVSEADEPSPTPPAAPSPEPSAPSSDSNASEKPKSKRGGARTKTVEPKAATGASIINPRDKSQLDPIHFIGRDDNSVERSLFNAASRIAGPKVKISLGAKRLGRESASNPNVPVFFYLGKMDPESEEIFLMADKNMQIAKDDSVQPTELQGGQASGYQAQKTGATPRYTDIDAAPLPKPMIPGYEGGADPEYARRLKQARDKELYGDMSDIPDVSDVDPDPEAEEPPENLTEEMHSIIKTAINKILDGK